MGPLFSSMFGDPQQTAFPMPTDAAVPPVNPMAQQIMPQVTPSWRPHEETFLGKLADGLLMASGMQPAFRIKNDEDNLHQAMKDFSTDPLGSIQRLSQIKGMEGKAAALYNQYQDNKRADDQARYVNELRMEHYRDRAAAMLGAVNQQNAAKVLPMIQNYARAHGLDESEIPSTYDEDAINTYRMGGMSVDQQTDDAAQAAYRDRRLGQIDQTIQSREAYQQQRLGQMNAANAERERHNRAMEAKPGRGASSKVPSYVNTKYGPGEVDPSGRLMKVTVGGVDHIYVNTGPNQWRHVKTLVHDPKTGQLGSADDPYAADDDEDDN